MSTLNCPPRLKHGDLIGIAAPAAPLWPAVPAAVNASFERSLAMLRRSGYSVRIAPHALSPRAQPDVPAYERAEDLNALVRDALPREESFMSKVRVNGGTQILINQLEQALHGPSTSARS